MGLYDTQTMLQSVRKMFPVARWFKDRYFPDSTVFASKNVLIEYKQGNRKLAPFVIPRKGGITMEREGYASYVYTPPYIAPQRPLTIDDLEAKGFGESMYSGLTPQQRQAQVLGEDLSDLSDMIDRRHEWMAREVILTGEVIMKHYAEKYGEGEPIEKVLRFYEDTFDNEFTPAKDWNEAGCTIYDDLDAMVKMLTDAGCAVTDLNMSSDAFNAFLKDDDIQKLFNNRRIELGGIAPKELPNGVAWMGSIVIHGKKLDIYVYDEQFEDEEGAMQSFMPSGTVFLSAPGMGKTIYGAITQIESSDDAFHTYKEKKVPKYFADSKCEVREIRLASAPVVIPNDRKGWVVATVL